MATITGKSGVTAVAMILVMRAATAASGDNDKLLAAFDILQQPAKELRSQPAKIDDYGCMTQCFHRCYDAGLGDQCIALCHKECGGGVQELRKQPAKVADYGCITQCFRRCYDAGLGDQCPPLCHKECSGGVQELRSLVGDICNIPSCISGCVGGGVDEPYCKIWCQDMCGDDIRKKQTELSP
uniref:Bifunctional inhibitor/plant lipid transfer protein/seed storage helical domain-containing protein n=1 Tax=Leersia perrieri TaxID=77586 RepID=A0A0D9VRV8_9ORYZ